MENIIADRKYIDCGLCVAVCKKNTISMVTENREYNKNQHEI